MGTRCRCAQPTKPPKTASKDNRLSVLLYYPDSPCNTKEYSTTDGVNIPSSAKVCRCGVCRCGTPQTMLPDSVGVLHLEDESGPRWLSPDFMARAVQ